MFQAKTRPRFVRLGVPGGIVPTIPADGGGMPRGFIGSSGTFTFLGHHPGFFPNVHGDPRLREQKLFFLLGGY
jgi:hypothetical protein